MAEDGRVINATPKSNPGTKLMRFMGAEYVPCLIVQDWRPIAQADKSGRYLLLIKLKYASIDKHEYAVVEGFWDHDFDAWTTVSGRKCEATHFTNVLPLPAELL